MLKRLSGFVLVLALTAAGGVVWSQALPRSAEEPPAADRDQIWRSIFARPQARPADALETKRQTLGALLFFDPRLSRDNDRSCAACHQPENGYSDGEPRARGRDGAPMKRNTPHLLNLAEATSFYWDGREPTLDLRLIIEQNCDLSSRRCEQVFPPSNLVGVPAGVSSWSQRSARGTARPGSGGRPIR